MKITLKYSCYQCGLTAVEVDVPARGEEDVVSWMDKVVAYEIKSDHNRRSPSCMATSVRDLMIPITGADKIGGPTVQ